MGDAFAKTHLLKPSDSEMPRSQATGTKMGKGAARAIAKNEECVEHYNRIIFKAEQTAAGATGTLRDAGLELARVTRTPGCGRLTVTLQDGTKEVSVPIGGTVKMRGHAGTKTDRANCMCVGDTVVLRGGIASAKLSSKAAALIKHQLKALNIVFSASLFAAEKPVSGAGAGEEDDLFEEAATETDLAEAAAAAAEGKTIVKKAAADDVDVDDI